MDAFISSTTFKVTRYEIKNKKISENFKGYKIVHLTDLHIRNKSNFYKDMLEAIKKEKPDIIVITGDIIDRKLKEVNVAKDVLKDYPKYVKHIL